MVAEELTKNFTQKELEDQDLLVYDPFYNKRVTIKIRRGGTWYDVSVIDMYETPKYDYTLICVHGYGSNALNYRFLLKYLSPYFRIIAYDLKGHGKSDKADDLYDLGLFTEELAQIVDYYDPENLVLIGHSMGTAIVMNYMYLNPQRAKAAVLLSGSADFEEPLPRVIPFLVSRLDERVKNAIVNLGVTLTVTRNCPPELVNVLREQNRRTPYNVYRKALLNTVYPWKKDKDLNKITEPTLLMVGDRDIVTPLKNSEKLNELLPNSRLVIIPNAAHGLLIEKGKHVALLIKEYIEFQKDQAIAKKIAHRQEEEN